MSEWFWRQRKEGWHFAICPQPMIDLAHERHKRIQAQYGHLDNHINQAASNGEDSRWAGRLGEMALADWFEQAQIPYEYAAERDHSAADFVVRGISCDLKTKSVGGEPRMSNTFFATIPEMQWSRIMTGEKKIQYFIFASYNYKTNIMYLLGGASVKEFHGKSIHRMPGEVVHPFYTVRAESRDILLSDLKVPRDWE